MRRWPDGRGQAVRRWRDRRRCRTLFLGARRCGSGRARARAFARASGCGRLRLRRRPHPVPRLWDHRRHQPYNRRCPRLRTRPMARAQGGRWAPSAISGIKPMTVRSTHPRVSPGVLPMPGRRLNCHRDTSPRMHPSPRTRAGSGTRMRRRSRRVHRCLPGTTR